MSTVVADSVDSSVFDADADAFDVNDASIQQSTMLP